MNINFTLDRDGFFTQECPSCEKRFKVNPNGGSSKPLSFCPYCAHEGTECWWTSEQIQYGTSTAVAPLLKEFEKSLQGFGKLAKKGGIVSKMPDESKLILPQVWFECCNEIVKLGPQDCYYCVICGEIQGTS